jgi:hypothetical protein
MPCFDSLWFISTVVEGLPDRADWGETTHFCPSSSSGKTGRFADQIPGGPDDVKQLGQRSQSRNQQGLTETTMPGRN